MKIVKISQELQLVKELETLNEGELTRALRDAIIAELGAIKQYENLADSINNKEVSDTLRDIANEEKVHVGELQELLKKIDPKEQEFLDNGAKEVQNK